MAAIDDDPHAFERHAAREAGFGVLDVAPDRVLDPVRLADLSGGGTDVLDLAAEHEVLDLLLDLVVELVAVGTEELDPVVVVGVVRSGDDDASIGAQRTGHVGDAGRGQRSHEHDVDAHRQDAGGQGVLQHVAGKAGVLADDDAIADAVPGLSVQVLEDMGGGASELESRLGGHRLDVGAATDTVGSEDAFRVGHGGFSGSQLVGGRSAFVRR